MNPPLHGEKTVSIFTKIFTWGNKEIKYLRRLIDHLKVREKHSEIHLLGFSLGARVVLRLSARPESISGKPFKIDSVITIAPPFRIDELNGRFSGDIRHPFESVFSMLYAFDRSTIFRILTMVIGGNIADTILCCTASPAAEIPHIKSPFLLIHSADDWLIKSYHSVKLFEHAGEDQQVAIAILNTRSHAEDLLSRDKSAIRHAFFKILDNWFAYIKSTPGETQKKVFNENFRKRLESDCILGKSLYDAKRISMMSVPTTNNLNTNIWVSAADQNHSLVTLNTAFSLKGSKFSRYFVTSGSTGQKGSILKRLSMGLSFERQTANTDSADFELYTSIYRPFGHYIPIIHLRRLTYIQGIGGSFNRRILSADISLFKINFRFNYGRFFPTDNGGQKNVWQIDFNAPLISDAAGSYYLGMGYSRFLSPVPGFIFKSNLKAYLFVGPAFHIAGCRVRGHIQVEQDGRHIKGARHLYSAGLSVNFAE